LQYVCHVLNQLVSATLKWLPLLQVLKGQAQDTSTLLVCSFYEPVYFSPHYDGFPSNQASDKIFVLFSLDTPGSAGPTVPRRMPTIDPKDLIGRSFLKDTEADGQNSSDAVLEFLFIDDVF
jgi:hypothetical protein